MRHTFPLRLYYPNHTFIGVDRRPVQYQWLPRRLLLVRHGESEANVNREVYSNTPDWRIALTERGKDQAFDCGRRLRRIIGNEKIYIYYSPYMRTRQTLEEIRKSLDDSQIQGEREDERLREQEMGNYQPMSEMDATWAARNRFSRLYYRFPFGESSADVGDRVSSFFDSLLRERIGLTVPNMNEGMIGDPSEEVAWLGLGRWRGREGGDPDTGTPVRANPLTQPRAAPSLNTQGTSGEGGMTTAAGVITEARHHGMLSVSPPTGTEGTPCAMPWQEGSDGPGRSTETGPRGPTASAERVVLTGNPHDRPVSELGAAMDRGVLPPNDLGAAAGEDQNVVIVAHGLLIRLFIGRWFRVPMEVFETMGNPPNCSITVLERHDDLNRLVMTDISKQFFGSDPLLQMMRFDGREDTQWYRERFLGIIDPERDAQRSMQSEDDDENHYSRSKTPHEYEPPGHLRDFPPVQRPRSSSPSPSLRSDAQEPGMPTSARRPSPPGTSWECESARSPVDPTRGNGTRSSGPPGEMLFGSGADGPVHPSSSSSSHAGYLSPSMAKHSSSAGRKPRAAAHEWGFELAGGQVPNVGPSEEDSEEIQKHLNKYLSRGFW